MTKVYIIDDDPLYLTILSTKLWQSGYTVKTIETVEKAIALIQEEQPDAIILDHNFKNDEKKGLEYIGSLRKHAPKAGILYITSDISPEILDESIKRGADTYLKKDNNLNVIISDAIEEILKIRRTKVKGFWKRFFK